MGLNSAGLEWILDVTLTVDVWNTESFWLKESLGVLARAADHLLSTNTFKLWSSTFEVLLQLFFRY